MVISQFTIQQLVPFVTGDTYPPSRSGRELVALFNKYGSRDIYDEFGLPDIGKQNGQRPSRKQYAEARMRNLVSKLEFRELLMEIVNNLENYEDTIPHLNKVLNPEGFSIVKYLGLYTISEGVVNKQSQVINYAHFQNILNSLLLELENAKVSIRVAMAWFTNEALFNKLLEKFNNGVDVEIAIFDDRINQKFGVDLTQLPHRRIKKAIRGGLMHNKFCVIDNQVVVTGSYNWTNNAEFRNDDDLDPNLGQRKLENQAFLTLTQTLDSES
ncbi:phospholipase D-like domain-containing protein [Larkinella soli]|uniref:phospholipase D-like domain-containing protein n=1 Tax=Larkinella soli TaxID=1770527 RepID=UPI000FFB466E|nr:phospholipase D-like domain-containing protein [Larkinella soli]